MGEIRKVSFWGVLFLLGSFQAFGQALVQEGVWVPDPQHIYIKRFTQVPVLTIDHMTPQGYELYGPTGLKAWLQQLGIASENLGMDALLSNGDLKGIVNGEYPSFQEIQERLQALQKKYTNIFQLFSIGKSNDGRDLWVMKISDHPTEDEAEPEVKYISSMHGDEITGRELMMRLIDWIGQRYGDDPQIKDLVDNTEIFIMPSMNPDGSERIQRGNALGYDLNRDFPDFSTPDHENNPHGRQVETQAVMKWQGERHFALSANFHGGAQVVNYPWDTTDEFHPFNDLILDISRRYADKVPYMRDSRDFEGGVVRGYVWYEVDGGMQDWSDFWYGDLQVTIELSNQKWPRYSEMDGFFADNKDALLHYLGEVHQGTGFVLNQPGLSGQVRLVQKLADGRKLDQGTYPFSASEFYKVLPEGVYDLQIQLASGQTLVWSTQVQGGDLSRTHYASLKLQ